MPTTAFVSTYVPYRCGIATFTYDLATAAFPRQIVAIHPPNGPERYPAEVRHRIKKHDLASYLSVAHELNTSGVDAVSVQHEYGIWGGQDGSYVLDFVEALRTPVVTTLHTVMRTPSPEQRRIVTSLIKASTATVVMSFAAASLLESAYGADASRVQVIPHGVPNLPLVDADAIKPRLGLEGHQIILSFGLLGPGKGYEAAIAAMPAVVAAHPNALYVVLGATHPELLLREGEAYRERLVAIAESLGVADHVRFVDRFVDRVELGTWLEAADVFVTPYPNMDQIVSGTLSYAMGAGKAVVSTPYAYARERLAEGRGVLVTPGSTDSLSDALVRLLGDPELRRLYGHRAYEHTRSMVWSAVGAEYTRVFSRIARPVVQPVDRRVRAYATASG